MSDDVILPDDPRFDPVSAVLGFMAAFERSRDDDDEATR